MILFFFFGKCSRSSSVRSTVETDKLKKSLFCSTVKRQIQKKEGWYTLIILITGASHTGKTILAQRLLEQFKFPYLSIDHIKMGLIRSGQTKLTPCDDEELTPYLWNIVKEIIKTAIENEQNLIIEGCYIPFNWKNDFSEDYLKEIRYICLVMSANYIAKHFEDIVNNANAIEHRIDDNYSQEMAIKDNTQYLRKCKQYDCRYFEIDDNYDIDELWREFIYSDRMNGCWNIRR